MQEAGPSGVGSMAAIIGLDDESIIDACKTAAEDEVGSAGKFNAPGQVVIAGHVGAVDRAIVICKEKGAKKAMPLSVSAPFHSALLKPAADRLAEDMAAIEFTSPTIPVVHNVNAQTETDPMIIKQRMIEQIYHPVLWVDCVNVLLAQGITKAAECGPGKVLSGLVKRIDKSITSVVTDSPEAIVAA
jgi:[acyl-carrier-protein] S-malonyltransferase